MLSQNNSILHIDDDPLVLRIVGQKLKSWGYDVCSCPSPMEGLEKVRDENFRLVLLDVDMPEMSGIDVLEQIKDMDGGVQVIMLTGMVSMATILQTHRRGAEALLFKPIEDFEQLRTAIDATQAKLNRWWKCLQEMQLRRSQESFQSSSL